jgi:hypothetical protein
MLQAIERGDFIWKGPASPQEFIAWVDAGGSVEDFDARYRLKHTQ